MLTMYAWVRTMTFSAGGRSLRRIHPMTSLGLSFGDDDDGLGADDDLSPEPEHQQRTLGSTRVSPG